MIFTENICSQSINYAGIELYEAPVGGGERIRTLPRDLYNNPDALRGARYVKQGYIFVKHKFRCNGC